MAFDHASTKAKYQSRYLLRQGCAPLGVLAQILTRHRRPAIHNREHAWHHSRDVAIDLQGSATRHYRSETSPVEQRQLALPHGVGGEMQRFANVGLFEIGVSGENLR